MFDGVDIAEEKLLKMYATIPRIYAYIMHKKKMQEEILEINKTHAEIFSHLDDSELSFYSRLNKGTADRLVQLIEIEKKEGKKSWSALSFAITERVKLYKKLFSITDADIAKEEEAIGITPSKFNTAVKFGTVILGVAGALFAGKKVYDHIVAKKEIEKK